MGKVFKKDKGQKYRKDEGKKVKRVAVNQQPPAGRMTRGIVEGDSESVDDKIYQLKKDARNKVGVA